ncbi:hypothetical protein EI94DRAFT_1808196 [Lactarius quietus]|nr:hypothetical protein EI94DRAFT_1808196 [Lactarius quietus]
MPNLSNLPARNSSGRFLKKEKPPHQPNREPTPPPDPIPIPETSPQKSERTPSCSTPLETPSPSLPATSRSSLVFPKPVRHLIPGSFSPFLDHSTDTSLSALRPESPPNESSPSTSVPISAFVTCHTKLFEPSTVPIPDSRSPSPPGPESLEPQTLLVPLSIPSSPDSDSSQNSSLIISTGPQNFLGRFSASRFLMSRPNPSLASPVFPPPSAPSTSSQQNLLAPAAPPQSGPPAAPTLPSVTSLASVPLTPNVPINLAPQPPIAPALPPIVSAPPIVPLPPPAPLAPPLPPVLPVPPVLPPIMAANLATGPSAMPYLKDHKAPHFSGEVGDRLDDFLQEYEELANLHALTAQQKLETVLRYVPTKLQDLWQFLDGYANHDWTVFRRSLEHVYRTTSTEAKYSKARLFQFVVHRSRYQMLSEEDVHRYYREFLVYCQPLITTNAITTEDKDSAFWNGFHIDDRKELSARLFAKLPNQRSNKPFDMEEVYETATFVFGAAPYIPLELRELVNNPASYKPSAEPYHGPQYNQPDYSPRVSDQPSYYPRDSYYDRDRGRPPNYSYQQYLPETPHTPDRSYHPRPPSPPPAHTSSPPRPSVETRTVHFKETAREEEDRELDELINKLHGLSVAKGLRKPENHPSFTEPNVAPAYQNPVATYQNATPAYQNPMPTYQNFTPTYQNPPATYPNTTPVPPPPTSASRAPWADRITPAPPPATSEPIFLTSRCVFCSQTNHRIKECPTAWEYIMTGKAVVIENCDSPNTAGRNLQAKLDAWIAGTVATAPTHPSEPVYPRDPPPHATHCFEIIRQSAPDRLPNTVFPTRHASKHTLSTSPPCVAPQYRYQSLAEDQHLTAELLKWLLDGKLSLVTPAHILAASSGIRKSSLIVLGYEELIPLSSKSPPRFQFPLFPIPSSNCPPLYAEYSLPLREVDILVNDTVQRQDLAQEASVHINYQHQLEMEGANGLVSKTKGCAENLTMQIGDVVFEVHAHVVEKAPFRLLLGRPFHHLLLCKLEDLRTDALMSQSMILPTPPTSSLSLPACKAHALELVIPWSTGSRSLPPERVLAYKRVDRKVRPVPSSLPEDYRIIRRFPPTLFSHSLAPHHPPNSRPEPLTQERLTL